MKEFLLKCFLLVSLLCRGQAAPGVQNKNGNLKKRKIIIDTDAGVDDAVAILLALKYEEIEKKIEILAITCTYGNTKMQNVEKNVQKILTVAKRKDIPIYGGAEKPLLESWVNSKHFGEDGMNDFEFTEKIIVQVDKSKHAAQALVDLVKANPGEVTIIALGPPTNIALAATLDSSFMENVDQFVVMGSTVNNYGNVAPGVDFNFGCDPESNYILMMNTKKPILLIPREASLNSPMFMKWRKNILAKGKSPVIKFLNKAEKINKDTVETYWSSADPRAVAAALWPGKIINKSLQVIIIPVREGEARGSVLVDRQISASHPYNANTVMAIDVDVFMEKLVKYLNVV